MAQKFRQVWLARQMQAVSSLPLAPLLSCLHSPSQAGRACDGLLEALDACQHEGDSQGERREAGGRLPAQLAQPGSAQLGIVLYCHVHVEQHCTRG